MPPIWALREVPIGALLSDTRDCATVVGVERDGTRTTGDASPTSPLALALAVDSLSSIPPPTIIYANALLDRSWTCGCIVGCITRIPKEESHQADMEEVKRRSLTIG